ncbi:MAG: hypothetical protein BWX44_01259 [Spirochaetes bacterium ADurb.Bin001]|nr:MAG: hypothetical protein BWX44_01259 [Spirochaetes bacterium ADurb.Bin001]
MAAYTAGGVHHFRWMIPFLVESRGEAHHLPGTVGDAKTASLAAVFNHDHLPHFPFSAADLIRLTDWIFFCFLHEYSYFPREFGAVRSIPPDGLNLLDDRG